MTGSCATAHPPMEDQANNERWLGMVVLDRDPFEVPADELSEIAADLTVIGRELVFQRIAA